jgi:hypothetical protein
MPLCALLTPYFWGYFWSISVFYSRKPMCLWFKTRCTFLLVIWDLKHNLGWPPPFPPHSGNVSDQAFFLCITAQPSFSLYFQFMSSLIKRVLWYFFSIGYPPSHYSCFGPLISWIGNYVIYPISQTKLMNYVFWSTALIQSTTETTDKRRVMKKYVRIVNLQNKSRH